GAEGEVSIHPQDPVPGFSAVTRGIDVGYVRFHTVINFEGASYSRLDADPATEPGVRHAADRYHHHVGEQAEAGPAPDDQRISFRLYGLYAGPRADRHSVPGEGV